MTRYDIQGTRVNVEISTNVIKQTNNNTDSLKEEFYTNRKVTLLMLKMQKDLQKYTYKNNVK